MKKTFKKTLALLLAVMMIISIAPLSISAEVATYGDLTYEIVDGEVIITDCDESFAGEMIIPETIEGYPVTSIGDYAFFGCNLLTSITIGNSVTSIGDHAFCGCNLLTSITIGNSVTSIGYLAFSFCESLTSITIPDSVTSIGDWAFSDCTSLTNATIGNSVTSIGECAFSYCDSLTSITIPDSVTSIEEGAFAYCTSLTSITIPDSVTSIGRGAFRGCTSLEHMKLPFVGASATASGSDGVFGYIFDYTSSNVEGTVCQYYQSDSSYYYYIPSSLRTVEITNATQIPFGAFYNCSMLTDIIIPDGVTSIGEGAFAYCTSLTSITINNPDCEIYDSDDTIYYGATIYGYEGSTAQSYAEKYNREFVIIDECEHNYESEIITPATHFATGLKTFTCSVCGDSYTEVIEKLTAHEYTAVVTAPTCTEKGYTTYTCVCGDSYVADYVDSLGHTDSNSDSVCDECSASIKTVDKYIFKNLTEFFQFLKELIMKIIRFFTQGI